MTSVHPAVQSMLDLFLGPDLILMDIEEASLLQLASLQQMPPALSQRLHVCLCMCKLARQGLLLRVF